MKKVAVLDKTWGGKSMRKFFDRYFISLFFFFIPSLENVLAT